MSEAVDPLLTLSLPSLQTADWLWSRVTGEMLLRRSKKREVDKRSPWNTFQSNVAGDWAPAWGQWTTSDPEETDILKPECLSWGTIEAMARQSLIQKVCQNNTCDQLCHIAKRCYQGGEGTEFTCGLGGIYSVPITGVSSSWLNPGLVLGHTTQSETRNKMLARSLPRNLSCLIRCFPLVTGVWMCEAYPCCSHRVEVWSQVACKPASNGAENGAYPMVRQKWGLW